MKRKERTLSQFCQISFDRNNFSMIFVLVDASKSLSFDNWHLSKKIYLSQKAKATWFCECLFVSSKRMTNIYLKANNFWFMIIAMTCYINVAKFDILFMIQHWFSNSYWNIHERSQKSSSREKTRCLSRSLLSTFRDDCFSWRFREVLLKFWNFEIFIWIDEKNIVSS